MSIVVPVSRNLGKKQYTTVLSFFYCIPCQRKPSYTTGFGFGETPEFTKIEDKQLCLCVLENYGSKGSGVRHLDTFNMLGLGGRELLKTTQRPPKNISLLLLGFDGQLLLMADGSRRAANPNMQCDFQSKPCSVLEQLGSSLYRQTWHSDAAGIITALKSQGMPVIITS